MRKNSSHDGHARMVPVILLCLFLALTVAVNILASILERKNGWRVDYSFNAAATTGEVTRKILKELPYPVTIYVLAEKGDEDPPLNELLDRYAAESENVTWELVSPSMNPALLTRFSSETETVTSGSVIVSCEKTGRWKILDYEDFLSLSLNYDEGEYEIGGLTYESSLTGAISYVTQDRVPRIVLLQGHGELDAEAYATLKDLLEANHYDVEEHELSDPSFIPDPENDLLVFLSPLRDLMDTEMTKIDTFGGQGGSFLFTCDYSDPIDRMPNYMALLRNYGFIRKNGIVVADRSEPETYYNNIRIDLLPEMCSTDITLDLISANTQTLLLAGTAAFETPTEGDRNLITQEVLKSGKKAYLKVMGSDTVSMEKKEGDVEGPFSLALQARRITPEGYVSRAFVLGCSTLLTDEQVQLMTDSQSFIIRVTEFLLGQKQVNLGIMPKLALRPQLSAKGNRLGSVILVALPMVILFTAIAVLIPRKRK